MYFSRTITFLVLVTLVSCTQALKEPDKIRSIASFYTDDLPRKLTCSSFKNGYFTFISRSSNLKRVANGSSTIYSCVHSTLGDHGWMECNHHTSTPRRKTLDVYVNFDFGCRVISRGTFLENFYNSSN